MLKRSFTTCLLSFALAAPAFAVPVKLSPAGDGTEPANSGQGTIEGWLSNQISYYNANNGSSADLPTSYLDQVRVNEPAITLGGLGNDEFTLNNLGGYLYIVFHWGGPANGGGKGKKQTTAGPAYEAYFLNGLTSYTFLKPGFVGGLSWWGGYGVNAPLPPPPPPPPVPEVTPPPATTPPPTTKVPDTTSTIALCVFALLAIASFGRRRAET